MDCPFVRKPRKRDLWKPRPHPRNLFRFFDPKRLQHVEAVRRLERSLREKAPELLSDDAYWVQGWCANPQTPAEIVLQVPYYAQFDTATSQGARMCFSSSCAM